MVRYMLPSNLVAVFFGTALLRVLITYSSGHTPWRHEFFVSFSVLGGHLGPERGGPPSVVRLDRVAHAQLPRVSGPNRRESVLS